MHKNSQWANAALVMAATSSLATAIIHGYDIPSRWAPSFTRSNNKSRTKRDKERARFKVAAKSRRDQHKAGKR